MNNGDGDARIKRHCRRADTDGRECICMNPARNLSDLHKTRFLCRLMTTLASFFDPLLLPCDITFRFAV